MISVRWLVLEPLDTVVIRDGRAFDAGTQSEARSVLPSPTTTAGAVGAAYGADPGAARADRAVRGRDVPAYVQGPVMAYNGSGGWEARWPVPRDVVTGHSGLRRLSLTGPGDAHFDLEGDVEFLLDDVEQDGVPVEGWWGTDALTSYLDHGEVWASVENAPWAVERRVGLARDEDRTAAEGMFYSSEHRRFTHGHALAARCLDGPDRSIADVVDFGGRGKRAQVHQVADIPVPEGPGEFPEGRMLIYLATPAVFPDGRWHPDLSHWPGTHLVSAAVGPAQVVTTATAHRATGEVSNGLLMWAVPAGSVYYLRFPSAEAAKEAAKGLRYEPVQQYEDWMNTAGFGLAFTGRWDEP
jgi:CRISPR/Cas system CMR-associated protein Cmr3 (group 5 of RAMP superfamily)